MKRVPPWTIALIVLVTLVPTGAATDQMRCVTGVDGAVECGDDRVERADESAQSLHTNMVELAEAWSISGGEYGFSFWSKAQDRWENGEISASLFREYVSGYRDQLVAGCDTLDGVDMDSDVARSAQDLVVEACQLRVDALRAQHAWLGAQIELDADAAAREAAGVTANEDAEERVAELQETVDERQSSFNESMQQSLRAARLAMNIAQSGLDDVRAPRISESAFL